MLTGQSGQWSCDPTGPLAHSMSWHMARCGRVGCNGPEQCERPASSAPEAHYGGPDSRGQEKEPEFTKAQQQIPRGA